eukprot:scaffold39794_cov24-Phaeocystis_antarctica.AAC.1
MARRSADLLRRVWQRCVAQAVGGRGRSGGGQHHAEDAPLRLEAAREGLGRDGTRQAHGKRVLAGRVECERLDPQLQL